MERLNRKDINSPEEYDHIFSARKEKGVDWFDLKRWKKLLKYYKGGAIADIGCLDSLVLPMAKQKNPKADAWGFDVSEVAIREMKNRYWDIHWIVLDAEEIHPNLDNYFDYIVLGEVLEHKENPYFFLERVFRKLKPGGVLALSVPLGETEAGEVDGERHLWSFNKTDIKDLLLPFSSKVKTKKMGSRLFPYRYHFPNIIAYAWKK